MPGDQADVFFVTLVKSEAHFSPTTMYADRAISPTAVPVGVAEHDGRARRRPGSATSTTADGLDGAPLRPRDEGRRRDLGAPPYLYAGPMTYESHTGDRPMRILWQLEHALPADVFHAAKVA